MQFDRKASVDAPKNYLSAANQANRSCVETIWKVCLHIPTKRLCTVKSKRNQGLIFMKINLGLFAGVTTSVVV